MSSAIGVSYTAAGMGGMGIALDATYSGGMGIDWTNDPIVTGTSSANTAHFEAGIPTSLGTVAAGSLDVNKCGIQAAKVGEGPGVSLYVAGGVAHTGLANMTLQDLVNVIETLPFQMVL